MLDHCTTTSTVLCMYVTELQVSQSNPLPHMPLSTPGSPFLYILASTNIRRWAKKTQLTFGTENSQLLQDPRYHFLMVWRHSENCRSIILKGMRCMRWVARADSMLRVSWWCCMGGALEMLVSFLGGWQSFFWRGWGGERMWSAEWTGQVEVTLSRDAIGATGPDPTPTESYLLVLGYSVLSAHLSSIESTPP